MEKSVEKMENIVSLDIKDTYIINNDKNELWTLLSLTMA